ncbi:hypothetical protein [Nocardia australiensis]|uniref:hypothetical protein n=1 Tax=Nocardia australiensis TaxID=2887191 RepID=UPI001D13E139|nr:hypothetical protein [Nocardia australiensis]
MADRSTPRSTGEVPEADLAEQSIPAYPDDDTDEQELAAAVDREASSANLADVVEQSIPVPLDDDREVDTAT